MQYNITLDNKELETISRILQEWPYKMVAPILDNIAKQVEVQNKSDNLQKDKE